MRLAVREAISEFSMQRSGVAVLIDMEAFSRGGGKQLLRYGLCIDQ